MSTNTVILVRLEEAYLETTIGWGRRQVNLMFTQYYNVLKTMSVNGVRFDLTRRFSPNNFL